MYFRCKEFQKFSSRWDLKHIWGSANRYLQSCTERAVQKEKVQCEEVNEKEDQK